MLVHFIRKGFRYTEGDVEGDAENETDEKEEDKDRGSENLISDPYAGCKPVVKSRGDRGSNGRSHYVPLFVFCW